jgi:hypothetical protein
MMLGATVGAYRSMNFWRPPDCGTGYLGGAVIEVLSGGPVAAMAGYDRFDLANNRYGATHYEGITLATRRETLPHVWKSSPWTYTGIPAQNASGRVVDLKLQFYDANGGPYGGEVSHANIPVEGWTIFYTDVPSIEGSAANLQGLAALMVNFDRCSQAGFTFRDCMMGYSAVK